ncbi:hypothetical protein [Nitratireductor soli]|uniref:hypothetical protein n=1 Tax=Nitratireductor soli TaxID=1670619 RepID=UPI00065E87ED|nr:hypothetical protein [Nitratireductor soli]
MSRLSLELSDGIAELRAQFDVYAREALVLPQRDARALQVCCDLLYQRARAMETALSQHLWNEAARRDRAMDAERIAAELERPGTNIALFPVVPRPQSAPETGGAA